METEDSIKHLLDAMDILAKDSRAEMAQDIKNIAVASVDLLKAKIEKLEAELKALRGGK